MCKFIKNTTLIKFAFIIFLLFAGCTALAQPLADSNTIDIALIPSVRDISDKCVIYVDSTGNAKPDNISVQAWKPLSGLHIIKHIPDAWVTMPIYLKFTLINSSDSTNKIFFIASTYVRNMEVYKMAGGAQPVQLKNESRANGFQPIELNPLGKQAYVVKYKYIKRNFNYILPELINKNYLVKYRTLKYFRSDTQLAVGYLLGGVLLMMIFFTGANYIQSKKKEFLFNCCYSICMFGLIFLNTFLERKSGTLSSLFNEYLDFLLLLTGTIFYIAFTRKFLDTKLNYPLLNKIFMLEEKVLVFVIVFFTFIVFFTNNFHLQIAIENVMKLVILLIGIIYIIIALSQKNELMNYLAIGNAILILFSLISFYVLLFQPRNDNNIFTNSMMYYEVGIVGELIFFLLGLAYKNRVELIEKIKEQESLKLEAERLSFETKLTVLNAQQKERNRISADMHDDLGAGVTAIRLYSELAKKRIGNTVIPEIEKISSSANELLNNMNAIIWTMSSSNDSLDNMVAYIRGYALEYLENTGITCHTHLEENIPNIAVSGEIRRNVYLVVKESLNNILKHSKATIVTITLKKERGGLSLYIHDNGTGIDFDKLRRFGNGLNNMKKRMEKTGILFTIENKKGTLITLHRKVDI